MQFVHNESEREYAMTEKSGDEVSMRYLNHTEKSTDNLNLSMRYLENFAVAFAHGEMNPRKRHTMEDCHRVIPELEGCENFSYFGVYDGESQISKDIQMVD